MADLVKAPWTIDQVLSLYSYQRSAWNHPFTCGNDECKRERRDMLRDIPMLIPTVRGWVCLFCDYTQDWCHEFMCDWSWQRPW